MRATLQRVLQRPVAASVRAMSDMPTHSPLPFTMPQAIGVAETCLLYLDHGHPGRLLDDVQNSSSNGASVATRWRELNQVLVQTQVHAVVPFGYAPDASGLQQYYQSVAQQVFMPERSDDVVELLRLNGEIWDTMLQRGFGLKRVVFDVDQARHVASRVAGGMQDPELLARIEKEHESNWSKLTSAEEQTELMDQLCDFLKPCWIAALGAASVPGLGEGDDGWVQLQAAINEHAQADLMVAQTVQMGLQAVAMKAPASFMQG